MTCLQVCVQRGLPLDYRLQNNGCTKTCGGGIIDYSLVCVEIEGKTERPVDSSLCISQNIPRPPIPTTACSAVSCPPLFLLTAWSTCSSSCDEGTRTRTVRYVIFVITCSMLLFYLLAIYLFRCRQIQANGIQIDVGISVCVDAGLSAPESSEACNVVIRVRRTGNLNPCPLPENFEFETSPWSTCTQSCHLGRRTRTVRCREIDRVNEGYGRVYDDEVCIRLGHIKPPTIEA